MSSKTKIKYKGKTDKIVLKKIIGKYSKSNSSIILIIDEIFDTQGDVKFDVIK